MTPIIVTLAKEPVRSDAIVIGFPGAHIWIDGVQIYGGFSTQGRICAALLLASVNGYVTYADLIEFIWGDDHNGGPMSPITYIAASVTRRRTARALNAAGISLRTHWGRGIYIDRSASKQVAA